MKMAGIQTKDATQQDAEKAQQKKRPEPTLEHMKALADESVPFGGLSGVSGRELPLESTASLLGDPRFSHPANNTQKAGLVTELQQTYGNLYVQRLVESLNVQAKLTVSSPDDQYEKEADRVADAVTRGPASSVQRQAEKAEEEEEIQSKPIAEQITPLVQRQEEEPEEEEEEEEPIQTKKAGRKTPLISSSLQSRIDSLKGGGQPLPESTRSYFEPRFGYDFSQVRVHTDSKASETAEAIHAEAFTKGRDIVFGAGRYSPGTLEGERLLAHELTHVIQQQSQSKPSKHIFRAPRRPHPLAGLRPWDLTKEQEDLAIDKNSKRFLDGRAIEAIRWAVREEPSRRPFDRTLIDQIARYQYLNKLRRRDGQVDLATMVHMAKRLIGSRDYDLVNSAIWLVVCGRGLGVANCRSFEYVPKQTIAVQPLPHKDCRFLGLGRSALRSYEAFEGALKRGMSMAKGCTFFEPEPPIKPPKRPKPKPPKPKPPKDPDPVGPHDFLKAVLAYRYARIYMGWMAGVVEKIVSPKVFDDSFMVIGHIPDVGCYDKNFTYIPSLEKIILEDVKTVKSRYVCSQYTKREDRQRCSRRRKMWISGRICFWGNEIHKAADQLSQRGGPFKPNSHCPKYYWRLSNYRKAAAGSNIYKLYFKARPGSSGTCMHY
jgi:hypothetical protein